MLKAVALRRFANVLGLSFVFKLCRVDADDRQLFGILPFQFLEVGKYVDAVDSPERPELDDRHLPLPVGKLYRFAIRRVQP